MRHPATQPSHLSALLDRLSRIASTETWAANLNPAQAAALSYLSRANQFSRSPSHVAEYLGSTRGTVSQSLKSLQTKGLIEERRSDADRRSISYSLTQPGWQIIEEDRSIDAALRSLDEVDQVALEATLTKALTAVLRDQNSREFGICKTCRHHDVSSGRRQCRLLNVALSDSDSDLLCHEHASG